MVKSSYIRYIVWILLGGIILEQTLLASEVEDVEQFVEKQIENRLDPESDETQAETYETWLTLAIALYEDPLDLNRATAEDLERIVWLSDFQIKSLLQYRTDHGFFASVYELAYVLGFDADSARELSLFVKVGEPSDRNVYSSDRRFLQSTVVTTFQSVYPLQKGYRLPDSVAVRYLGTPYALSIRIKLQTQGWMFYGTMDKDAGEPLFREANANGFDAYRIGLRYQGKGFLRQFIAGDYQMGFGQGLVAGSGLSFGMQTAVQQPYHRETGLKPFASTSESGFLSGVGVSLQKRTLSSTFWYAHHLLDASLQAEDSTGKTSSFSSFQTSGMHRTPTEMKTKHTVEEEVKGIHLQWNASSIHWGVTGLWYAFDKAYHPEMKPYRMFAFTGNEGWNIGLDYRFTWGKIQGFGEVAQSENHAWAQLHGMQWLWPLGARWSVIYRNYQRAYHTRYGKAFGSASSNSNEEGFYVGCSLPFAKQWEALGYVDLVQYPWLKYGIDAPLWAREYLLRIKHETEKSSLYVQFQGKQTWANQAEAGVSNRVVEVKQFRTRFFLERICSPSITLTATGEYKAYGKAGKRSRGKWISADFNYNPPEKRFKASGRVGWFHTRDYNSRIYVSEKGMLYGWNMNAFYGQGIRLSLMLQYKMRKHATFRFKWASTLYSGVKTIGSGLSETEGPIRSELKIQWMMKW